MKFLGLVALLWLALAGVAHADPITPTTFEDPIGAGSCPSAPCSLRQAIATAPSGATIQLLEGTYRLTQGTSLQVSQALTLAGAGREKSIVDGGANAVSFTRSRILKITAGAVNMRDLTFANGADDTDEVWSTCSPCDVINFNGGGAIYNVGGTVAVESVRFESNTAPVGAGVASAGGTMSLTNADFVENSASFGAGVFVRGGTVTVDRTTVRDGSGTGALYVRGGHLTVTNTTVSGNGFGISGGAVGSGVVNQAGALDLINVTITGNSRGGLETDTTASYTNVQNSILGVGPRDQFDVACVSPGVESNAVDNLLSGQAVTAEGDGVGDDGHNVSEDQTCPLTKPTDHAFTNALLAPSNDNGGESGWTAAPLYGSSAIDTGDPQNCSELDQRGFARDGVCDIGAIEAVRHGAPTAIGTAPASIGSYSAQLTANIDLQGEAGQLKFRYGINPSPSALINTTKPVGAYGTHAGSATAEFLDANTTYYFQATVDNATGSYTESAVHSFKTAPGVPQVSGMEVVTVNDTTVKLNFTIDPAGGDTNYVVVRSSQDDNGQTAPVNIAATAGAQPYSATLEGLRPGTEYTFRVLATNGGGESSPDNATVNVSTLRQIAGEPGADVALADEGLGYDCPQAATVDWGDGTDPEDYGQDAIDCADAGGDQYGYTLDAEHRYGAAGHYLIEVTYDTRDVSRLYASIKAPAPPVETPTATPTPTPTPPAPPAVVAQTPTPTATPVAPVEPVFHQSVIVVPSGVVLVKLRGSSKFVPLQAGRIPLGAQIDATKGKVTLTSVPKPGAPPETATFSEGIFTVTQSGAVTVLTLSGPLAPCGSRASSAAGKKPKTRKLWGDGKGNFRTQGKYSAATIRGTRWLVQDSCTGTLTRVAVGVVSVNDPQARKTITLRAGKSYLAKPRKRR